MLRTVTRLGEGGRLVIPKEFRKAMEVKPGERVVLLLNDGELRVISAARGIKRAQEILRPYVSPDRSLVDELIAERRWEAELEEWEATGEFGSRPNPPKSLP